MFTNLTDERVVSDYRRYLGESVFGNKMKLPSFVLEVITSRNGNSFSMANKASTAVSNPFTELLAKGPWLNVSGFDEEIRRKGERDSIDHFCGDAVKIFVQCLDVEEDMEKLVDVPPIG